MNLSKRTEIALKCAQKAGALLKSGFGTQFAIDSKEGKHNLVTEYDHKSEALIISTIKKHFPDDGFLSEEKGFITEGTSGIEWVIDPLDGTVNFAHGIPMFSVSIAARKKKELILGVVLHPLIDETFIAEKGKGAYLNGNPLSVTSIPQLSNSILGTGFPYNLIEDPLHCIEKLATILKKGLPIRRIGVASLDIAYVAAGRFDGFFEVSLKSWDMAAANLLVEEAGGKISDWQGKPLDIDSDQPILITNSLIHQELIEILRKE